MSFDHKAQVLVISCIDFRFQKSINDDLKSKGLEGRFDRIALPGASKDSETVSSTAKVSLRLHDPDEALIYEHEDCGAYAQDNSSKTHKANAQKLANALKEIKPSLQVKTYMVTFRGVQDL